MTDRGGATPGTSRRDWLRKNAGALAAGGVAGGGGARGGGGGGGGRAGGGLAGAWGPRVRGEEGATETSALIVRSSRPLDLETPVEVFDRFLTPNELFFVRSHFGAPAIELGPWRLSIRGQVERPI